MKEHDPYPDLMQGFADSTGRGVRWGPSHLFTHGNEWNAVALCGRRVKLWNFEGHTETDICPRCRTAAELRKIAAGIK